MRKKQSVVQKQRHCFFCANNIQDIAYTDTQLLRRFVSSFGKIVARKRSGVCMSHQRELATAIKRARIMALLPFLQR